MPVCHATNTPSLLGEVPEGFFFLCKILLRFTECHRSFVLCHTSFRICGRACDKWFCVFSCNEINAHVLVIGNFIFKLFIVVMQLEFIIAIKEKIGTNINSFIWF